MNPITIVAHAHQWKRGIYKDNTLEAFLYALEHGADMVEMDMRFDHYKNRFYLEHNFFWWPRDRENTIDKVIPHLPKGTNLMIELKTLSWLRKRYARNFMKAVEQYQLSHNVVLISYNPFILFQLREFNRNLQMGFICPSWLRWFGFIKWVLRRLRPEVLLLQRRILKEGLINYARARNVKIFAYILNTREDWQKAKDLQLDGIVTDHPAEAKKGLQ